MKFTLTVLLLCSLPIIILGQEPRIFDPVKFDQWGDIPFHDETARLDNAAIQLRDEPGYILYLVIYAAKQSCVGEARARGIRAKNYLIHTRHLNSQQIVWIDGGFREELVTDVWIWPPNMKPPAKTHEDTVKANELVLDRRCRIKCRSCAQKRRA